jgi:hypothetical protein
MAKALPADTQKRGPGRKDARPAQPPTFDRLRAALASHVKPDAIAELPKARLRGLERLTGESAGDFDALVAAHKLEKQTGLPASVAFALQPEGGAPDAGFFASQTPAEMRKTIASAIKKNVVGPAALSAFENARPGLTALQTNKTPIRTLVKTYELAVSDALVKRLEARKIETLAELRVAGDAATVAKLINVKPGDAGLALLLAHANLSLIGTDVATNAAAIKEGYAAIPAIADAPADVFAARLGPSAGFSTVARMHGIASAQTALLRSNVVDWRVRDTNGLDLSLFPPRVDPPASDPRCGCDDCSSAVSPLAYLADLIGYATTKIGTLRTVAGAALAPVHRLYNPQTGDRFFTQSRQARDRAQSAGYIYEEIAFYLLGANDTLTQRLSGLVHASKEAPDDFTDHLYTISADDKTSASNLGYASDETLGFIYEVAGAGRTPLYRLVSDLARQHVFTMDPDERTRFLAAGFREEGIRITGYVPKDAYDLLTAQDLARLFCQPFDALPTACELMDEKVRQVRICIEVLRAYCQAKAIALPAAFKDKQAQYLSDTYQELLSKLGASYAALRASRGASAQERADLAAELGIPAGDGAQRDYLAELLLDADAVTETDLEHLFGLADTSRDPLSHGAKLDDNRSQVTRWNFANVAWNISTDSDGCVFASLSHSGGATTLEVRRAPNGAAADLQASGTAAANATIVLAPTLINGETDGLAGELDVAYAAAASDIKFQVVPQFTSWRLQALRTQWQAQDWISDRYSALVDTDQRLPVIDPDLIGPDDFRDPFGTAGSPFKTLWQKRRAWVDDLVAHLAAIVSAATPPADDVFTLLFQDMRQTTYAGTSVTFWPATAEEKLAGLAFDLQGRLDTDKIATATAELWTTYRLSPEMLVAITALKKKHEDWSYDTSNPALDQDGWTEAVNILVQAQKSQWAAQWIADEAAKSLLLGPQDFWIALAEPKQGDWPPAAPAAGIPRIDPETVKLDELPDATAGALAITLWDERQTELQGVARDLAGMSRDLAGATRRIKQAFPDRDIAVLEQQYADLTGTDAQASAAATAFVTGTLNWSADAFRRVMELRGALKAGQTSPKPSNAEWAEMEALLVTAYKQYGAWATWRQAEDDAGLAYWDCLKARLPRWRAPAEARPAWQQALRARSAPAIIDPDLLRETHFRSRRANPALALWRTRGTAINTALAGYRPTSKTKAALETLLGDALGPFASAGLPAGSDGLRVLLKDALAGNVAAERLDQLTISRAALDVLARMHALLAQSPPQKLTASEWDDIAAVLTQVTKLRRTAAWREEERAQGVTRGPDWFKVPAFVTLTRFPPPSPPPPPTWRGTPSDVQDWEDALQSRIDQEAATIDAVRQTVSEVEADRLPALRDALVTVCGQGSDLEAKAEWLTARLLINCRQGGCALTTRIAQAIETLQQLLWGVRTGLIADAYPTLTLIPAGKTVEQAIAEFDQAWAWIGSYATWRAAMFVFLYPENLLLPTLKRHQTPAFRRLSDDFRNTNPISPQKLAVALTRFYGYFDDVRALTLEACQATTSYVYAENEFGADIGAALAPRAVEYLFATTPRRALYWSVVDKTVGADWAQTYWRPLTGFKNDLVALVGCTVFKTAAQRRLLYLFAKTTKDGADKLEFLRLDLDRGGWDTEASEITLDSAESNAFDVDLERGSDETRPPTLFLIYPDQRLRYTLGTGGSTDQASVETLGTTLNWSDVTVTNLGTLPRTQRNIELHANSTWRQDYLAATSLCVAQIGGQTRLLAYWAQHAQQGGASLVQRFCAAATIAGGAITWGNAVALDAAPVQTNAWDYVWPVGFATADIRGTGATDLLWCYLKLENVPTLAQYRVYYAIGWDLRSDGVPNGGWSTPFRTDILLDNPILGRTSFKDNSQNDLTNVTSNGLKATVVRSPDGSNRLVVAAVSSPPPAAAGKPIRCDLFVTQLATNGDVLNQPWRITGPTSTVDGIPTGIGIAFADLGGDTHLDALVFYLMRPTVGGETVGQYFVGANCGPADLAPGKPWSAPQPVGGQNTWFGGLTGGAAIAVAPVDDTTDPQRPVRPDLIVFHDVYGGSIPGVDGDYRIGYDIGFEPLPTTTPCQHDNFKPVAEAVPLSFSGFEALDLNVGSALQFTRTSRNLVYVEEAFHFVPVLVALQLQSAGEFVAALDWFRLVYDYTLPATQRRLVGLAAQITQDGFTRDDPAVQDDAYDWLLDPLNPHSIARTRRNTYLRYVQISIVKCLLDYADREFTTDTSQSVPRARKLYRRALDLLGTTELRPASDTCEGVRGDLEIMFADAFADLLADVIQYAAPTTVGKMRELGASLTQVFARYGNTNRALAKAREAAIKLKPVPEAEIRLGTSLARARSDARQVEAAFMADASLSAALDGLAGRLGTSQRPGAPDGYLAGGGRPPVGSIAPLPITPMTVSFCVPKNPLLRMLRLRANLNLYKIDNCRNITGFPRQLDPYAAPTDTESGLPSIGPGGALQLPGTATIRPTPYRYQALIERAKQLVQLAMQVEQAYLAALEKSDAEEYAVLKARQDLSLSAAGVRLQELRVTEAQGGVTLAGLQRDRAGIQVATYEQWMSAGLGPREQAIVTGYIVSGIFKTVAIAAQTTTEAIKASGEFTGVLRGFIIAGGAAQAAEAITDTTIAINRIWADYDRRMQEWQFQKALAVQDLAIAYQQVDLAEDHVRVTEQERTIAQMQHDNASEVVDFLAGKFTNRELYDWMSNVLERVYSFFLQQATATAQLAQNQLAFERQQTPPAYIQSDYWQAQGSGSADGPLSTTDRRGLTGSARLLQDIYQLDQYAFDTNKLKLQLTKTISLAALAPYEFQRFRETGILPFATPMELFHRDFPGHYLRLIKRVRVSLIALVPAVQGICATLSSSGLSQVVIGGDIFQTVSLRRDPETIALTSPINATGLFDLDIQQASDMRLPMENTGVATSFEFRMLKSANQFDYDSIADVLLTIDYTALNSFDYYAQVIQTPALTRPFSADRPYSFRTDFADAWYDLHNPDQSATPMVVRFATSRDEFPPNLANLKIQNVLFYIAASGGNPIELEGAELRFTDAGGGAVGGRASSSDGVISTRRGNAGAWSAMIGKPPFGQWELRLPNTTAVRALFPNTPADPQKPADRVAELLLVLTYTGRTPPWPS